MVLKSKEAVSLCISKELQVLYAHYMRLCLTLRYGMASEPTWEAVKFQNFLEDAPRLPKKLLNFVQRFVQTLCAHAVPYHWRCPDYATV